MKSSSKKMIIYSVCRENTCRSPMAAAIMQFILGDQYDCKSAGIRVDEKNQFVDPRAVSTVREKGYGKITQKNTTKISPKIVAEADMIFCMGDEILAELIKTYPESKHKFFKFAAERNMVPDPFDLWGFTEEEISRLLEVTKLTDRKDLKKHLETYKLVADLMKNVFMPQVQETIAIFMGATHDQLSELFLKAAEMINLNSEELPSAEYEKIIKDVASKLDPQKIIEVFGKILETGKNSEFVLDTLSQNILIQKARHNSSINTAPVSDQIQNFIYLISLPAFAQFIDAPIEGENLLHKAVKSGDIKIVNAVLLAGATPSLKNNSGLTAIELADPKKDQEIISAIFNKLSPIEKINALNNTLINDNKLLGELLLSLVSKGAEKSEKPSKYFETSDSPSSSPSLNHKAELEKMCKTLAGKTDWNLDTRKTFIQLFASPDKSASTSRE